MTRLLATAALGRILRFDDQADKPDNVAVISFPYWVRQFAQNPAVLGRTIYLNSQPYVIIGVAAPGFTGVRPGQSTDIWIPVTDNPALRVWDSTPPPGNDLFNSHACFWMTVMGRLAPHVSAQQATSALANVFQSEVRDALGSNEKANAVRFEITPGDRGLDQLRRRYSKPLWILMSLVTLGLLAACANVATLLLTRATGRHREMAVRLANGASRSSLIQQLLTETTVLSILGGMLGLFLARWTTGALVRLLSTTSNTISLDVHADPVVIAFTLVISVATGFLFGLAPALHATRVDIASTLKQSSSTIAGSGRASWWTAGNVFVVAQLALSLVLLVAAGLLIATLRNLQERDLGFEKRNLLLFAVDPTRIGMSRDDLPRFYSTLLHRVRAVPAVQSATMSQLRLISDWTNNSAVLLDGRPPSHGQDPYAQWNIVGPEFFETMRMPMLAGRGINARDQKASLPVTVVNRAFADYYFPGINPIGHRISVDYPSGPKVEYNIVGISGTALYSGLREDPPPTFYLPYTQMPRVPSSMNYELRTAVDPRRVIADIRRAVRDVNANLLLSNVETQEEQIDEALVDERVFAQLGKIFSLFVLLLAAIGLYGTVAYAVSQRTSEIGIRMAVGAVRRDILAIVLRRAAILVVVGAALGSFAALLTTKVLASVLFGVHPGDALTLVISSAVLVIVSALASRLPAQRAASFDPLRALRWE